MKIPVSNKDILPSSGTVDAADVYNIGVTIPTVTYTSGSSATVISLTASDFEYEYESGSLSNSWIQSIKLKLTNLPTAIEANADDLSLGLITLKFSNWKNPPTT